MARRIIWTSRADTIFTEILSFYIQKTKSKSYSRKLNTDINEAIQLLASYPFLGIKTSEVPIRFFIKNHFKIFYEIRTQELIIHLVWDTRQDPKTFRL